MKFNDWLLERFKELDWSQADLARASGLTRSVISKYMAGRIPDEAALHKIARALKLPPEEVFRAAGILPPLAEINRLQAQVMESFLTLTPEQQQEVLEYIRFKNQQTKPTTVNIFADKVAKQTAK